MKIGNHSDQNEWELGDLTIQSCSSYKYLGDIISNNGKNKDNISDRKKKVIGSTMSINTIAANEVLNKVETMVILELHEKINIPGLLNNAESWNLLKTDQNELEEIETTSLKCLFNLPTKTPTPAILYSLGTLFTTIRVDK